jgi:hypothetical protein
MDRDKNLASTMRSEMGRAPVLGGKKNPIIDKSLKEEWINNVAARNADHFGDIENLGEWDDALPKIKKLHREKALSDFNERLADPDFAKQFYAHSEPHTVSIGHELPRDGSVDREKNLAAWHEGSHSSTKNPDGTPKVFYHGTRNDFSEFNKEHRSQSTRSIFVSQTPEMAHFFATVEHDKPGKPNIMPLFVHTKNPFDYENPDHVKKILNTLAQEKDLVELEGPEVLQHYKKGLEKGDWNTIEDPWVQDAIEKNHDGFFAHGFFDPGDGSSRGEKFLSVFNPNQVKSATGNQGTFDPSNPDITKADGGALDDGITAYHGSPHDFERFDTSKIGTGEGNQSYGHGLYFAQDKNVAENYRKMEPKLTSKRNLSDEAYNFLDEYVNAETNPKDWLAYAIKGAKKYRPHLVQEIENLAPEDLSHTSEGKMYEVHIKAKPEHFLDWDAPLNEQSDHVKSALSNSGHNFHQMASDMFDGKPEDLRGADIYHWLSGEHEGGLGSPKNVTDHLSQKGIPGIKYLDAGSRGQTDKPTRNYVVFDDKHVGVKRKYEQGGRVAFAKGGRAGFYNGGMSLQDWASASPFQANGQVGTPPLSDYRYYNGTGAPAVKPEAPVAANPADDGAGASTVKPSMSAASEAGGFTGSNIAGPNVYSDTVNNAPSDATAASSTSSSGKGGFGSTVGSFGSGLLGAAVGTAIAGPIGGLVGGMLGRGAYNSFSSTEDEQEGMADEGASTEGAQSNSMGGLGDDGGGDSGDSGGGSSGDGDSGGGESGGGDSGGGGGGEGEKRGGRIYRKPSHKPVGRSVVDRALMLTSRKA